MQVVLEAINPSKYFHKNYVEIFQITANPRKVYFFQDIPRHEIKIIKAMKQLMSFI